MKFILKVVILTVMTFNGFSANKILEKVKIKLNWKHQFQFAGYYAAKEKGFYEEEGLDVELIPLGSGEDQIESVVNGNEQYGIASPRLMLRRFEGLPVVLVAQIFQHSPYILITKRSSGINSPFQLQGKKILYSNVGSNLVVTTLLNDIAGGLSGIEHIPRKNGILDFFEDKVDAVSGYISDQPYTFEEMGIEVNIINPQNYGVDYYGDNLFTTEDEVNNHHYRVEKMKRASLKGWQYALDHKEEIIKLIRNKYNPSISQAKLVYEAGKIEKLILHDLIPLGNINLGRMKYIANSYFKLGLYKDNELPEGFIFNPHPEGQFLTDKEMAWLKKHPDLEVGTSEGNEPFIITEENGLMMGFLPEYLEMFNQHLSIHYKMKVMPATVLFDRLKKGDIPVAMGLVKSKAEQLNVMITEPFHVVYPTLFSRVDSNAFTHISDLKGRTVAVVKSAKLNEITLAPVINDIKLFECNTALEALTAVYSGQADAMLGLTFNGYLLPKYGLTNIIPAIIFADQEFKLYFGIHKNYAPLVPIFNKVIKHTDRERNELLSKWIHSQSLQETDFILSHEEKQWLINHPVLKVGCMINGKPVEFIDEKGDFQGISIDFMNVLGDKLGIKFNYQEISEDVNLNELINNIDFFSGRRIPNKISHLFDSQEPYYSSPITIFIREDSKYIGNLGGLSGLRVSVLDSSGLQERISNDFPDINVVPVHSAKEGLTLVSDKVVNAFIGSLTVTSYIISKDNLTSVKVAGETPYVFSMKLFSRKDWPELSSILSKAMNSLSERERNNIANKWVSVKFEHKLDYSFILKILGSAFLIILGFILWNRKLKTEVIKQTLALRISERKFKDLYFNAQVAMGKSSFEDGHMIECNEKYAELWGYDSIEECLSELVTSKHYVNPEDRDRIKKIVLEKGRINNFVTEMTRKDGSRFWMEFSTVFYSNENYFEVVAIDVTERNRVQEELMKSERNYRLLAENAADVIWTTDKNMTPTYISPSFEKLSKFSLEEALKISFLENFNFDSRRKISQALEKLMENEAQQVLEVEQYSKNNKTVWVEISLSRLIDETGNHTGYVGTTRSIEERIRNEREKRTIEDQLRQTQKMESIGTLAGGIAHDFNNILAGLFGYAELVQNSLAPGSSEYEMQSEVLKAGERARDLVKQILLFSRQSEHKLSPIQPHLIVKEVLKLIRSSIPTTIEIISEVYSDCGYILADATQIHQIVMNLCTNAYYAMKDTGGVLHVSLKQAELTSMDVTFTKLRLSPGKYIKLVVSDTGYGMDRDTVEKIFTPYFTTKPVGEGTGLGMSVVHGIVKSYNGHINVYSELNKGTSVNVYIPIIDTEKNKNKRVEEITLPRGTEKIMVVDDEEMIVNMLLEILKRQGYQVQGYNSGLSAYEAFISSKDSFDLILTDLIMPKVTGLDLAEKIFQTRPDIPIIICTGFSETLTEEKALALGIKMLLHKPLLINEVVNSVRKVLDDK